MDQESVEGLLASVFGDDGVAPVARLAYAVSAKGFTPSQETLSARIKSVFQTLPLFGERYAGFSRVTVDRNWPGLNR
jgi:hypothetical protein